jgi:hypothetical protein
MAESVFVPGAAPIRVGTGAADALELLGYTKRGADLRFESMSVDVPGDQNGGEQGPPIDIEYLGDIAHVRLELSKVDKAVRDKLMNRLKGGTAGTPGAAGTLVFQDSKAFRLVIDSPGDPYDFGRATLVKTPHELNVGTLYQTVVFEFVCYKNAAGVLYAQSGSTTTTAAPTTTTSGG